MSPLLKQLLAKRLRIYEDVEQNTPEWLEMRLTKRTASETPIVMGLSPWVTPAELAMQKYGHGKPTEQNAAMKHGHDHEHIARKTFEKRFKERMPANIVTRGSYMASLDGWSRDRDHILEIKCPYKRSDSMTWQETKENGVPDHYNAQVQHQLMVSGAGYCHFWVFDTDRRTGLHRIVEPDYEYFESIIKAWERFAKRYA